MTWLTNVNLWWCISSIIFIIMFMLKEILNNRAAHKLAHEREITKQMAIYRGMNPFACLGCCEDDNGDDDEKGEEEKSQEG